MKFAYTLALAPLLLAGCQKPLGSDVSPSAGASSAPANAVAPPAGQDWVNVVTRTPEGGYRMGNPAAPVTLIEYGSRSCPHCAAFDAEGVPALKANYVKSGKLSYEFRDFPVHPFDVGPILLGQCVAPATFFPLLDAMMQAQPQLLGQLETLPQATLAKAQSLTPLQAAGFWADTLGYVDFVKQHGVPEAKARACLTNQAAFDSFVQNVQKGTDQYDISGTPTFIVNGKKVTDAYDWASLEPALKAAGA